MKIGYLSLSDKITVMCYGCNFKCKNCFVKMKSFKEIPPDELCNTIDDLCHKNNINTILIAGGEPTLQRDLPEFTKYLKNKGKKVILTTNGYYLKDIVDDLFVDEIHVDLKAFDDEKHKYLTGKSNKNVLKCIEYLADKNFNFEVDTVLIPNIVDVDEIEKIAEFLSRWDVKYRIIGYTPFNNNLNARKPTKEELLKAKEIAKKYLSDVSTSLDFRRHKASKKIIL
ncbi:radical SAM protein [Methanotorris formicicus]|uniref:Radical SAM domain protein n=1 Tax=Methanotorris formicicus Mc-S-70 TaxID=647171 RepID=H1KXU2_9EURY|nr:radical SAM protein [Methanotorris formicicus]EHP87726.1 Radical SAM domain protein [Methanotorris formicicus Mc-S-70]